MLDTDTQPVIAALWSRLLDLSVGPDDDLFDLGADSVMMLNAQFEAEKAFGCKVATCKLMETPSVAGWSAVFDAQDKNATCA